MTSESSSPQWRQRQESGVPDKAAYSDSGQQAAAVGPDGNRVLLADGKPDMEMLRPSTMAGNPESGTRARSPRLGNGEDMNALIARLFPICRSITGPGVRETLTILSEIHPVQVTEIPSGTRVFDWVVPKEWSVRDAYVKNAQGERIIDFQRHNLHLVSYSVPIRARMKLRELQDHLYSLPDKPDVVPYRTSYYAERWGFCLTHAQRLALDPNEVFEVVVDSTLQDGSLTIGEIILPGESREEVLITTHLCHPSLCNDNLSGLVVAIHLAAAIAARPRRLSFRFLFIPGTIGSLAWLATNEEKIGHIKAGLVITGVGDAGAITYKKSRRGNAIIDRAAAHVLRTTGRPHRVIEFHPYGYDERQFCSPGFNLGVGRFSRTPHGEYPEYHTSADNPDFVKSQKLEDSFEAITAILEVVEQDRCYLNLNPKGEPQLGKRGLYRQIAGHAQSQPDEIALLWVLAYSDGHHSLLDIAEKAQLPFPRIKNAADQLRQHDLLREAADPPASAPQ
jgi:aminopeptidase-like protein